MNQSQEDLVRAAKYGSLYDVENLLDKGCSSNARDSEGFTAMYWAACKGHVNICARLLASGCDINMAVKSGATPLMAASDNGQMACILLLLRHRSLNINQINHRGDTALHMAAFRGYIQVVKALISAGCDVFITNMNGKMAVHDAFTRGNHECAQLLEEYVTRLSPTPYIARKEPIGLQSSGTPTYSNVEKDTEPLHGVAKNGKLSPEDANGASSYHCGDLACFDRTNNNGNSYAIHRTQHSPGEDSIDSFDWPDDNHTDFSSRKSREDSGQGMSGDTQTNNVLSGELSPSISDSCSSSLPLQKRDTNGINACAVDVDISTLALLPTKSRPQNNNDSRVVNDLSSDVAQKTNKNSASVIYTPNVSLRSTDDIVVESSETKGKHHEKHTSHKDHEIRCEGQRTLAGGTIAKFVEDLQMKVLELEGNLSHAKTSNNKLIDIIRRLSVENAGLRDENSKLRYTVNVLLESKQQNHATNTS